MGYQEAMKQFQENVRRTDASSDHNDCLMWNLNAGLGNLTEALSQDLREIKNSLQTILEMLQRVKSK